MKSKITGKQIALTIFLVIVIILGIWYFFFNHNQVTGTNSNQAILFTREDCPHCQNVKKFIADNHVDQKISFQELDVKTDQTNSNLLIQKATDCKLDTNKIGVPFYWHDGQCLIGDTDIISYFNSQIAAPKQ
jgi:glutaredoxin